MLDRFPHLVPKLGIKQVKHDRDPAAGLQITKPGEIGKLDLLAGHMRAKRAFSLRRGLGVDGLWRTR